MPAYGGTHVHSHFTSRRRSWFALTACSSTALRRQRAIEVLFGLLIISGALPQLCVLIAGIPFNASLYFFGTEELLGHLPIYAAMLVLLVYGSQPELRPVVSALRPPARPRHLLPALKGALQS